MIYFWMAVWMLLFNLDWVRTPIPATTSNLLVVGLNILVALALQRGFDNWNKR